ncbi:MAG: ABC transporter substrate-binding protein [Chthoniobacterales bacterium]
MTKLWKNLLVGGFLAAFVILLGFFNATKPRILVLHSAAQDSSWARQVDRGMREALAGQRRPLSIEWHYLGVDSPAAARRMAEARAGASRAMARFNPDVLIAVDDEANSLVAREYVGRDRPRILYVSLNRPPADFGYAGARNVSGISEQLPLAAIRDAARDLFPDRVPSLAVIGVDNETGRAEMAQVTAFDWSPLVVGETLLAANADEWRTFAARTTADILLVLGTHDLPDGEGNVVTAAEINRWTQENASAFPIGTQVNFVEDGGGLSFSPPPDDSGAKAIELALDWLDNRSTPGAPAPVVSDHFEVGVRPEALAARGIALPPIYLEAARENGSLFGD